MLACPPAQWTSIAYDSTVEAPKLTASPIYIATKWESTMRTIAENFSDRFDYTWQYTADPQHLPGAWLVECQADELSSKVDAFCAKPFLYFLTVVITDHSTEDLLIPLAVPGAPGDLIIWDVGHEVVSGA